MTDYIQITIKSYDHTLNRYNVPKTDAQAIIEQLEGKYMREVETAHSGRYTAEGGKPDD